VAKKAFESTKLRHFQTDKKENTVLAQVR